MDNPSEFIRRIPYSGSLDTFVAHVVKALQLGEFIQYSIITVGYEDLNIRLETKSSVYLVKCFGSFRDYANCKRYVDILTQVVDRGIRHPKLYENAGSFLHNYKNGQETVWYCVMDFIDGKSFYDLGVRPTKEEAIVLIQEAAKINSLDITPDDYYDEWSPVNFVNEYSLKRQYLSHEAQSYLDTFVKPFSLINLSALTQALVHGDIIRANVIKDSHANLYIVDYSMAARKPRLQELSVLLCGMFFNENDPSHFTQYLDLVKKVYTPVLPKIEYEALPLFITAVFAMYAMQGEYSRAVKDMHTKENDYWVTVGNIGLQYCQSK